MALFLGFDTARMLWRKARGPLELQTRRLPSVSKPPQVSEVRDARAFLQGRGLFGEDDPLHLVIPDRSCHRSLSHAVCHVWATSVRPCFHPLATDLFLSSPEASWRQMAGVADLVDVARFGYELCASYVPDSTDEELPARLPLTTPGRLAEFAAKMNGGRGCAVAHQALKYVAAGSASPRETEIALFLCLPRSVGGYGLPRPHMNERIPLVRDGGQLTEREYFLADLCWPEFKVCIEYDSDTYHGTEQRAVADSSKRNALQSLGYQVLTLTNQQVKDARRLDEAATALYQMMGHRFRVRSQTWRERRYVLRQRILYPHLYL